MMTTKATGMEMKTPGLGGRLIETPKSSFSSISRSSMIVMLTHTLVPPVGVNVNTSSSTGM